VDDEGSNRKAAVSFVSVEAALRASDERYRALFESMGEGFCVIEQIPATGGTLSDFRYVDANSAFARLSGVADVVGRSLRDAFPLEPQQWIDIYDKVVSTGMPIRFERSLLEQGRVFELYAYRLDDESHRRVGVIFSDVTSRKQIEAERDRYESRLRDLNADLERQVVERAHERGAFWQLTSELLGVLNARGYFEKSNPAWLALLGWTEDEVHSMSIFEMMHPDDVEVTRKAFIRLTFGEPAINSVNRYRCKDGGYRWISWTGVPDGEKYYCSGRDITAERRAQEALDATQEQLRQAQKMEAVGQLTGGIAHDFNNLLAAIGGAVEVMERRMALGRLDGLERYTDMVKRSTQRAAALTQRLLAFSRRQTLNPQPLDLSKLVSGMEEMIQRSVGPNVVLEVVAAPDLWRVKVDAAQLENALLNLCINRRDAMAPAGGRLVIETVQLALDGGEAKELDLSPGEYVSVSVADAGAGMTPDVAARAFDPFFTTKPLGEGTGLGLSMVYGFARQSGGQARIDSEVGRGTVVRLFLPRHLGEPMTNDLPTIPKSPADVGAGIGSGETVVVIDDEPTLRALIVEVLTAAGFRALDAEDGPSGLRVLEQERSARLLITDVGLPGGMNGRQVADAARVTRPDLKVLFITGYAESAALGDGGLGAGMGIITKPFPMHVLAAKARGMLGK
jgi:PAS domain S-box-containing protein